MPSGFYLLIAAQFTSALADNALLIVAIALMHVRDYPAWWAPLLKFSFTISYVLLAPFVGPLADSAPKARLMAWMNGIKVLGVLLLFSPVHPVWAYALVGLGAAGYAPAKYGLITELVAPRHLVAANGWIEVSIVSAVLLGVVLGGTLVSDAFAHHPAVMGLAVITRGLGWAVDSGALSVSLMVVLVLYGVAALLQRGVPDSGARYPRCGLHPVRLLGDFVAANRLLWRDPEGGLSLAVTTLFWGVGATLQFAVLRWAADALALPLDRAAYLQAVVALGVVLGAGCVGRLVALGQAQRVMPAGVLLGLLISVIAWTDRYALALPLLALVGAVGGVLVVPMNALLQHRGHQLLTAGRSVAVQGYNENLSVLVMLGIYAALLAADAPTTRLMVGFGLIVAAAMAVLTWRQRQRLAQAARIQAG